MNWSLGEIVNHLREVGQDKNTVFLFFSDNGGQRIECEQGGINGPLKGKTWAILSPFYLLIIFHINHYHLVTLNLGSLIEY